MQVAKPKTIHLKDYQPSNFLIDTISLSVDIFEDNTQVTSTMKIFKSNLLKGRQGDLEFNGENVLLKSLKLNGVQLAPDKYQLTSDKLIIPNITTDQFIIEIQNEINPATNKA